MGKQDRVCPGNPFPEQLQSKLGRSVDQEITAGQANHDAGPGPGIPRVVRQANRAVAAEHGNPGRGPAAEYDQATPRPVALSKVFILHAIKSPRCNRLDPRGGL